MFSTCREVLSEFRIMLAITGALHFLGRCSHCIHHKTAFCLLGTLSDILFFLLMTHIVLYCYPDTSSFSVESCATGKPVLLAFSLAGTVSSRHRVRMPGRLCQGGSAATACCDSPPRCRRSLPVFYVIFVSVIITICKSFI